MFDFLWKILLDQRGTDNPEPEAGKEPKPEEGAPEEEPAPGEGEPEPEPKPEPEPEPENRYEGFFEAGHEPTVEEVFAKLKETSDTHAVLTGKTAKTEANLGNLRKALKEVGITAYFDEDGQIKLSAEGKPDPKEKPKSTKKGRFTDEHRANFNKYFEGDDPEAGKKFEDMIRNIILDVYDQATDEMEATRRDKAEKHAAYMKERVASSNKLVSLYPAIAETSKDGNPNPKFDKKFHDLSLEIYEREYCQKDANGNLIEVHPKGQLWAAFEAATQLQISPASIEEAKKAGLKIGKENKKILGKVDGAGGAGAGKLSKEEVLALPPEEREAYNKKQMGID